MTIAVFLGSLLLAMAIGMPIAFALLASGVALMWQLDLFDAQILEASRGASSIWRSRWWAMCAGGWAMSPSWPVVCCLRCRVLPWPTRPP